LWLRRRAKLLRSRAVVRLSGPVVRCSGLLRSDLRRPHGSAGLRRSGLLRSDLRCPHGAELLCSRSRLRQCLRRRLRRQSEEALVPRLVRQVQVQEEPLLRSELRSGLCPDLRGSLRCPDVRRPDGTDVRRPDGRLLPLKGLIEPASVRPVPLKRARPAETGT
jgi:hypothetical protein